MSEIQAAGDLWRCPVCEASHPGPSLHCRRCGAQLMLLVKALVADEAFWRRNDAPAEERPAAVASGNSDRCTPPA